MIPTRDPNNFDLDKLRFRTGLLSLISRFKSDYYNNIKDYNTIKSDVLNLLFSVYEAPSGLESIDVKLVDFDTRDADTLNKPFDTADTNAVILLDAFERLQKSTKSSFNYLTALSDLAMDVIKQGATKNLDLRIFSGQPRNDFVVAGDDFADRSRIDESAISGPAAELSPLGGAVTLRRTGAVDILANDPRPSIEVQGPPGLYEGNAYGLLDPNRQARPEGTSFRFEQKQGSYQLSVVEGLSEELRTRYSSFKSFFENDNQQAVSSGIGTTDPAEALNKARKSGGEYGGFTTDEWEQIANNFHYERSFVEHAADANELFGSKSLAIGKESNSSLSPFTSATYIAASDPAEVKEKRLNITDDDASTFWEAELVIDTSDTFNRFRIDEKTLQPVSELSLEDIFNQVRAGFDSANKFLDVSIIIDLQGIRELNFITLLPMHFHENQIPEIRDIEYSLDGSDYTSIPEIKSGYYETRLAEDVNETLSREEVAVSLSANKFEYAGHGVFGFDQIRARYLRVSLREQIPVPVPYHILRFLLRRTVTTEVKERRFFSVSRKKSKSYTTRVFDLDYPSSLQLLVSEADLSSLTDGTSSKTSDDRISVGEDIAKIYGGVASVGISTMVQGITYLANQAVTRDFADALGVGGQFDRFFKSVNRELGNLASIAAGAFGFSKSVSVKESPWEVHKTIVVPKYDKARYAVGIRELRVFNYSYIETSEIVSTPFFTPKPIAAVSLVVDEVIPKSLQDSGLTAIRYYLSFSDGADWVEISPEFDKQRFSNGRQVPVIYHLNTDLPNTQRSENVGYISTDTPPRSVRFRAVLIRGQNTAITPVLKSYRLKLYVDGGL